MDTRNQPKVIISGLQFMLNCFTELSEKESPKTKSAKPRNTRVKRVFDK